MKKQSLQTSGRGQDRRYCRPRQIGDIINEMSRSDSPLAKELREFLAAKENAAEKGGEILNVNTELCIDLKTKLLFDRLMMPGKGYQGVLRLDGTGPDLFGNDDRHCTFTETLCPTAGKRNPRVYNGRHITATLKDDGMPRLNFKPLKMGQHFTIDGYAIGVMNEIRQALEGLVEK